MLESVTALFSPVETPYIVPPSLVRGIEPDTLLEFLPLELDNWVIA